MHLTPEGDGYCRNHWQGTVQTEIDNKTRPPLAYSSGSSAELLPKSHHFHKPTPFAIYGDYSYVPEHGLNYTALWWWDLILFPCCKLCLHYVTRRRCPNRHSDNTADTTRMQLAPPLFIHGQNVALATDTLRFNASPLGQAQDTLTGLRPGEESMAFSHNTI